MRGKPHDLAAIPSGKRPGTPYTGGWLDLGASLDGSGKSRTQRVSKTGQSSPDQVVILAACS